MPSASLHHAAGYELADDGVDTRSRQAYLGRRNITHILRYSGLAANRINVSGGE
jgi:site-specific recombinase XerD